MSTGTATMSIMLVAVIFPCIVIGLRLNVNLHQAGRSRQLIAVRGDAVQLIGHIKIPWQGYLAFIKGAFVIETLLLACGKFQVTVPSPKSGTVWLDILVTSR